MKRKILILGAEGMVGRCVFKYLSTTNKFTIYGTGRTNNDSRFLKYIFPKDNKFLEQFLVDANIDFIINCIGVLKRSDKTDYKTNYLLPKFLKKINKEYRYNVIQISSDAVFKDSSRSVNEQDKPKPDSKYGKSKLKGEIYSKNFINVRTSFIGYDPREKKGLIEWLLNNKDKNINGYIDQNWTGSTTLQFAKFCQYLITKNNFEKISHKTNVLHFTPLGPISKFELLNSISDVLNLKKTIIEKGSTKITRDLYSIIFDRKFLRRYTTEINSALLELRKFENS